MLRSSINYHYYRHAQLLIIILNIFKNYVQYGKYKKISGAGGWHDWLWEASAKLRRTKACLSLHKLIHLSKCHRRILQFWFCSWIWIENNFSVSNKICHRNKTENSHQGSWTKIFYYYCILSTPLQFCKFSKLSVEYYLLRPKFL